MARGDRWRWALIISASLAACVTNHAELAKKPPSGAGGSNAGGSAGASNPVAGAAGRASAAGAGHADDEPRGNSVLTFVNGVVDAPAVALCWAKLDAASDVIPFGDPMLEPSLEYGHSLVLHEVPGADWAEDTLQPLLIAGELELIAGLDCRAALARARAEEGLTPGAGGASGEGGAAGGSAIPGAAGLLIETGSAGGGDLDAAGAGGAPSTPHSRLRARGLPTLVAGTLNMGRSFALVANGCFGGAGFTAPQAEAYCGKGYSERQPTLSAALVSLSRRIAFDYVGMQVVNASLSNAEISLRAHPPFPSSAAGVTFAFGVAQGQVAPRPASIANTAMTYGSAFEFVLEARGGSDAVFSERWTAALARGGLAELTNGATFALVFNGPELGLEAVPDLWNGPALTVIAADPE